MSDFDGPALMSQTWFTTLAHRARQEPDRVALVFTGPAWQAELSFGEWLDAAVASARGLHSLGVRAGDRVAAICSGSPVWPILEMACSRIGAILVPLNSRYRADELGYILGRTQPKVVFFLERLGQVSVRDRVLAALAGLLGTRPVLIAFDDPDVPVRPVVGPPGAGGTEYHWGQFLALGGEPLPDTVPRPEDAVLMQFTSGSTSFPKGVLLGSAATMRATYELGRRMGLMPDDLMYSTQPMYHVGGSVATTLMALTIGCAMLVPERYTAAETFRLVREFPVTARTGQAAMYARELAHPDFRASDFAAVTKGWSGGTPELKRAIVETMGISGLVSMYGLTEASASTTVCGWRDPLEDRLRSSGRALPDLEVAIDIDGVPVERGTAVGEVLIRGWGLMNGYWDDEAGTSAAVDAAGWLHTGDLGRIDQEGYLEIVDRLKDMIKPGGENVSPAEVERVIGQLDGVAVCAVVGMPDPELGEVPMAFVELGPGALMTGKDIEAACRERLASFKVPRRVELVSEWPVTESGKIAKRVLRESVRGGGLGWVGRTG